MRKLIKLLFSPDFPTPAKGDFWVALRNGYLKGNVILFPFVIFFITWKLMK
jgi:hypothetical protein